MTSEEKLKRKMFLKEYWRIVFNYTCIITIIMLLSWFLLWLGKELSYHYAYKDMVKQTVIEILKEKNIK